MGHGMDEGLETPKQLAKRQGYLMATGDITDIKRALAQRAQSVAEMNSAACWYSSAPWTICAASRASNWGLNARCERTPSWDQVTDHPQAVGMQRERLLRLPVNTG